MGKVVIVSSQGTRLSPGQLRQLVFQKQCKAAFLNPILSDTVAKTIEVMEFRKEQCIKPEKQWFVERDERGTFSAAEWMGY